MDHAKLDALLEYLLVTEMPIRQFKNVGNWNKNSSFGNVDRKLLTSPKAVEKIHRQWQKTPYDFEIFLVNDPRVNKPDFREVGMVNLDYVRTKMRLTEEEFPSPSSDAITIIFTNNVGDERYMASGWILAHRLGHAFARGNNDVSKEWEEFTANLREVMADMLDQVYDLQVYKRDFSREAEDILKLVAQQIGTMKSARDNNLRNWGEFAYELFAQYLITGKIRFNPLPDSLVTKIEAFGRKATKRPFSPENQNMYNNHDLEYYAQGMETMIENVLDRAVGRIFVM